MEDFDSCDVQDRQVRGLYQEMVDDCRDHFGVVLVGCGSSRGLQGSDHHEEGSFPVLLGVQLDYDLYEALCYRDSSLLMFGHVRPQVVCLDCYRYLRY